MNIIKIEINGFRGIREFKVELAKDKTFVKFGNNGTGKTSLYQAIYFGVTGKFSPIATLEISSPILFRHKSLTTNEDVKVKLCFIDNNNDRFWIERQIDSLGNITSLFSDNRIESFLGNKILKQFFLNRSIFTSMIESAEREAWEKLSPILGFQEIANFREGIKSLSQNLVKDFEIRNKEEKIKKLNQEKDSLSEEIKTIQSNLNIENLTNESIISLVNPFLYEPLPLDSSVSKIPWDEIEASLPGLKENQIINKRIKELTELRIGLKNQQLQMMIL